MQASKPPDSREPIDFAQLCDVNDDFRMRLAKVSEGFCPYCDEPLERGHKGFWPYSVTAMLGGTDRVDLRPVDAEGGRCSCCQGVYATMDDGVFGPGYSTTGGVACEHITQLIRTGIRGVD